MDARTNRLARIKELIQEYADIPEDIDINKVVAEIDEMYSSPSVDCEPSYHHLRNILGVDKIVRSTEL